MKMKEKILSDFDIFEEDLIEHGCVTHLSLIFGYFSIEDTPQNPQFSSWHSNAIDSISDECS